MRQYASLSQVHVFYTDDTGSNTHLHRQIADCSVCTCHKRSLYRHRLWLIVRNRYTYSSSVFLRATAFIVIFTTDTTSIALAYAEAIELGLAHSTCQLGRTHTKSLQFVRAAIFVGTLTTWAVALFAGLRTIRARLAFAFTPSACAPHADAAAEGCISVE